MNRSAIQEAIQAASKNELTGVLCRLHHEKGYATKVRHRGGVTLVFYRQQLNDRTDRGILLVSTDEPFQRTHIARLEKIQAKVDANRAAVVTTQEPALDVEDDNVGVLSLEAITDAILSLDVPKSVFPSSIERLRKRSNSQSRTLVKIIRAERSDGVWRTSTTNTTASLGSFDSHWDAIHQSRDINHN